MARLFDPAELRSIRVRNRIVVSPMCQYSAFEGVPNDWHFVHLASRAVGRSGIVFTEATAVEAAGRISPGDTGIYNGEQQAAWEKIVRFIELQGSVPGIQLAHAGRKASTAALWDGGGPLTPEQGGWDPIVSASAIPFKEDWIMPVALDPDGLERMRQVWRFATKRAMWAGFHLAEIHAAHGYLLHQFLSPLSNQRTDAYGGSLENRMRFPLEIVSAVREEWPRELPLWVRISATDWVEGGWTVDDSVVFARECRERGVDVIDCSSGGAVPNAKIEVGPGYQVPFAERVRKEAGIMTAAVGMITEPAQAEEILQKEQADFIILARELLRDPYWPRRAARELAAEIPIPKQYLRAW